MASCIPLHILRKPKLFKNGNNLLTDFLLSTSYFVRDNAPNMSRPFLLIKRILISNKEYICD